MPAAVKKALPEKETASYRVVSGTPKRVLADQPNQKTPVAKKTVKRAVLK